MHLVKPTVRSLRRLNRQSVLDQIYFHGPRSRFEISKALDISPATVTNVTAELLAEGLIVESGAEESQGGRPRILLAVNPRHGSLIGVDVGETHIHCGLFDLSMRQLAIVRGQLAPHEYTPARIVGRIVAGLETLLRRAGEAGQRVIGLGIGIPGVVEQQGERVAAPSSSGWQNLPLLTMLKEQLHLPIVLDNGAKAMTLAEQWFGAGRGASNLVVLLIGTGVGSGVIADGELYRGATNSAGEWGHATIALNGRRCRCGSRGCLEAYVGAAAILARLGEQAPESPILRLGGEVEMLRGLLEAGAQGDPVAAAVLKETAGYLAIGIGNLINMFNPERMLLGGWAGLQLGQQLLPELRRAVERHALKQPQRATTLALCALGQEAVCMGAASLALGEFLAAGGARPTYILGDSG